MRKTAATHKEKINPPTFHSPHLTPQGVFMAKKKDKVQKAEREREREDFQYSKQKVQQ